MNNMIEKLEDILVGESEMVPLLNPKPKALSRMKNVRPITLLSTIRKKLSHVMTKRIALNTNEYLSHFQSKYRHGRNTKDIVWSHRWIIAKVQEVEIKICVIGIDISSTF